MTMTIASSALRADDGRVDDPDPAARPRRRSFTAQYKARILEEYDGSPSGSPQRGALLRREGLYSSHVAEWRKARDAGAREGLTAKPKAKRTPEQVEVARLRRRAERAEAELERTKLALEIPNFRLVRYADFSAKPAAVGSISTYTGASTTTPPTSNGSVAPTPRPSPHPWSPPRQDPSS